jgi:hypothetical protein
MKYDRRSATSTQAIAQKVLATLQEHKNAGTVKERLFDIVNIWATVSFESFKIALAMLEDDGLIVKTNDALSIYKLTDKGIAEAGTLVPEAEIRLRPKLVIILGVNHELQGAEKRDRNVDDPFYAMLLKQLIGEEGLDFFFEEATGLGPTIAENLSLVTWGQNHYLDVDPPRDERERFGIPTNSNEPFMIGSPPEAAFANWLFHEMHAKREELWVQRVREQEFKKALMICGHSHTFSVAFRLIAASFEVKVATYAK